MDVGRSFPKEVFRLKRVMKRLEDPMPVLGKIGLDMLEIEKLIFASRGRRGGGSWRVLKPDTIRKKGTSLILRTLEAKPNYSSLGNDTMYRSVTEPGAEYQIFALSKNKLMFGTSRPYAGAHQKGSRKRKIPARPFIRFLDTDRARWNEMILFYVTNPHRE